MAVPIQIKNHLVDDFPSEFEIKRGSRGGGVQIDHCTFVVGFLDSSLDEHRGAAFPVICWKGIERFQHFRGLLVPMTKISWNLAHRSLSLGQHILPSYHQVPSNIL